MHGEQDAESRRAANAFFDMIARFQAGTDSEKEKAVKEYESQTASYQNMEQQMAIIMEPENKKVM